MEGQKSSRTLRRN